MREALVFVAKTSHGSNLINIIKCIDTNPVKLTIPRLGQKARKFGPGSLGQKVICRTKLESLSSLTH